ncbi:MAG: hypothetical protein VB140_08805 [Burkholderia sp.]
MQQCLTFSGRATTTRRRPRSPARRCNQPHCGPRSSAIRSYCLK